MIRSEALPHTCLYIRNSRNIQISSINRLSRNLGMNVTSNIDRV